MPSSPFPIHSASVKDKLNIILALGVPAMIENVLQTLVGFVDTLFVAKLGLAEVAAVGVTNAILAVYLAIFLALGVGVSSLIARAVGAGEMIQAKQIAKQAVVLSIGIGILLGLITLMFAESILQIMGAEASVAAEGSLYFRIVGGSAVLISLMTVLGSILRASGDTTTPMKVGFWMNLVHILLDYILIFGFAGFTGWGIAGAAWATVLVRAGSIIALFWHLKKTDLSISIRGPLFHPEYCLSLLSLSTPAAAERLIMRLGQVLYFGLILRLGTELYSAHMIAGNIESFVYMPGYGLAVAATTLVGQNLGAKRQQDAYEYGLLTTGVAIVIMSILGVMMFFLSPWLSTWFTNDSGVIGMIVTALRIDAFSMPALAVGLVLTGALQGAGDTKSPMYSTAVGMWLIRVTGVYVLCIYGGMGIAGVWLAMGADLWVRAAYLYYRYRSKVGRST